jgi:carbamoyltransferase
MTLGTTNTSQNIFTREDISAGLQHVLEEVVIQYVDNLNFGDINLAVAGGIFANVKLNQKIARLPQIKNFFVYPNMGDGGLAVGSALLIYAQEYRLMPNKINDVYLGPEFSEDNILSEIKNQDVQYEKIDDIEIEIAELLVKGNIVARFNGRMEFGPRALGNRSILYTPTDKSVNEWLNKKLQRSEFMPFAPVTIKEIASKCYDEYNKEQIAANFMTITYNCTEYMKKTQPAVIHIDGTARPQIISEKINPSYYKIVKKFYELTDIPSLVNTSFNMHEDPIVCTPSDAIHAFKKGHLNYLAIGNFILKN